MIKLDFGKIVPRSMMHQPSLNTEIFDQASVNEDKPRCISASPGQFDNTITQKGVFF